MKAYLFAAAVLSAGPASAGIVFERSGSLEYGGSGAYADIAIGELSLSPGRYWFEITFDAAARNLVADFSSTGFYYFYQNGTLVDAGSLFYYDTLFAQYTPTNYARIEYVLADATSVVSGEFRTDYDRRSGALPLQS